MYICIVVKNLFMTPASPVVILFFTSLAHYIWLYLSCNENHSKLEKSLHPLLIYKLCCRLQWQSNRLLHKHERWRKSYSPKKDQTPLPSFVCYCSLLVLGNETTAAQTIYLFIYMAVNKFYFATLSISISSPLTSILLIAGYCLQDCQPWMGVFSSSWLSLPISKQYFPIVVSF